MDHREYHVTFGITKKLLKLEEEDNIMREIKRNFTLKSDDFIIQTWDTNWNDWIDICPQDLPRRAKLNIIEIKTSATSHSVIAEEAVENVPIVEPPKLKNNTDFRVTGQNINVPLNYFTPSLLKSLKSGERLEKSRRGQI